jgi:hypothetical protein
MNSGTFIFLLSKNDKWVIIQLTISSNPFLCRISISTKSDYNKFASWLRHYATTRKVAGSIHYVIGFFNWPNLSSRTMALGSTQTLTEMSTTNLPRDKGRPAHKANNLTAIFEPIV